MNLESLKIEIPYHWRIGQTFNSSKSSTGKYGRCLAYIDARDVMDLLDFVVGQENWQDEYYEVNGQMMCKLGIKVDEWVFKSDTGSSESQFESEKSAVSDAFKRAGVKWGVGRFLYDMDTEIVEVDQNKRPVRPDTKKRIYDLSEYINSKSKHQKRLEKAREQLRAIKKEA